MHFILVRVLACQAQVSCKGFFHFRLRFVWAGSQRQRIDQRSDTGGKLRWNRNGVAKLVPQQRTTGGSSGSNGQTCEGSSLLGMAESAHQQTGG